MYNILITGANGQLGRCIAKNAFTPNLFYIFLDKNKLNITDEETVRQNFEKYKPRVVINCAAYTNVDKAEKDGYQDAFNINAKGPEILARYCKEYDKCCWIDFQGSLYRGCSLYLTVCLHP